MMNNEMIGHFSNSAVDKVSQEREIFLRSALELLDERNKKSHEFRETIYRIGILRKAARHGSKWKPKLVEIEHGSFSYYDQGYDKKTESKKKIQLSSEKCQCRPLKLRCENGDCVFELSVVGGTRRIWQANSSSDRDAWIQAINVAMGHNSDWDRIFSIPPNNIIARFSAKSLTDTNSWKSFDDVRENLLAVNCLFDYKKKIQSLSGKTITVSLSHILVRFLLSC